VTPNTKMADAVATPVSAATSTLTRPSSSGPLGLPSLTFPGSGLGSGIFSPSGLSAVSGSPAATSPTGPIGATSPSGSPAETAPQAGLASNSAPFLGAFGLPPPQTSLIGPAALSSNLSSVRVPAPIGAITVPRPTAAAVQPSRAPQQVVGPPPVPPTNVVTGSPATGIVAASTPEPPRNPNHIFVPSTPNRVTGASLASGVNRFGGVSVNGR
jgi:hypothetical protein